VVVFLAGAAACGGRDCTGDEDLPYGRYDSDERRRKQYQRGWRRDDEHWRRRGGGGRCRIRACRRRHGREEPHLCALADRRRLLLGRERERADWRRNRDRSDHPDRRGP